MSPHLLFKDAAVPSKTTTAATTPTTEKPIDQEDWFKALLEKPFVPSSSTTSEGADPGPMLAKLPPDRPVSVGAVRYSHDDGVLRVVGEPKNGGKPEVQEKKLGLGAAAHYLAAYDAAIAAQYPKWDTSGREPPELWIALDAASKAATMAQKLDVGARSPHDAAKLLRSFMPKAGGIVATKTTMEQIQAFAGIAKAVTDGDPKKNLVDLEEKVLNAKGSSLLEEILKNHDRKTGARTLLDDLLDQPVKPAPLPADDKAVVARVGDQDITAGMVRDEAFRTQNAVAFQVEGFADSHGSKRTMTVQIERKGQGVEWSFHGVGDRTNGGRDMIISGDLSPAGLAKFQAAVERQPRYDAIPYKTTVPRFSPTLTDAGLKGLAKDRAAMEAEMQKRGGTPVNEIFPHLFGPT